MIKWDKRVEIGVESFRSIGCVRLATMGCPMLPDRPRFGNPAVLLWRCAGEAIGLQEAATLVLRRASRTDDGFVVLDSDPKQVVFQPELDALLDMAGLPARVGGEP